MSWYNERFDILNLSMYWDDLIHWETSYTQRLNVLRTKSFFFSVSRFCPQYIESLIIWSLSLYQVISIYWETRYIESLNILRWLDTIRDFIHKKIHCIEEKILFFFHFSDFVFKKLNLSIYELSHCINSSQYIETFNVSNLSLYQVISMYQKIFTLNLPPTAFLTCFGHSGIWKGKKRKKELKRAPIVVLEHVRKTQRRRAKRITAASQSWF